MFVDVVVEIYDWIVGRFYCVLECICQVKVVDEMSVVCDILKFFVEIGGVLVDVQDDGQLLEIVIINGMGWDGFKVFVVMVIRFIVIMINDLFNYVFDGYYCFCCYVLCMLCLFDF